MAILTDQFGWATWIQQGATVLLTDGFFITLVLAWYHGERGRQSVSRPEMLMVPALLVLAGAAIAFVREEPAINASSVAREPATEGGA